MPGPKMGPRPKDFDEDLVRQAPTFKRWLKLRSGEKLRYACREFTKGEDDDEERLMRRIMIARRNNLRDHAILKRARAQTETTSKVKSSEEEESFEAASKKKRGSTFVLTDEEVMREMDVPAVEATRSFKAWLELEDGQTFTYNQTYIKGKEGHEWLLKKNIWRRMRYRRENKKMVENLKSPFPIHYHKGGFVKSDDFSEHDMDSHSGNLYGTDDDSMSRNTLSANILGGDEVNNHDSTTHLDAVEAAVAAAESYVKQARETDAVDVAALKSVMDPSDPATSGASIHNPLLQILNGHGTADVDSMDHAPVGEHHHTPNPLVGFDGDALDVAAKLAAAASANIICGCDSDDDYAAV